MGLPGGTAGAAADGPRGWAGPGGNRPGLGAGSREVGGRAEAARGAAALYALAALATLGWAGAWALQADWAAHLRAFQLSGFALAAAVTAAALGGRAPRARWAEAALFWGVAAAARAALVPHPPPLSPDLFRYLWDALVWRSGVNPFRYPPLDAHLAALQRLHPAVYGHINYPEIPTIYPLASQLVFVLASFLTPGAAGLKAVLCAAELGGLAVLRRRLAGAGRPREWALLAAWHPLALSEVAANGHADGLAGVLLLLAVAALAGRGAHAAPGVQAAPGAPRPPGRNGLRAAVALAGAVLVKWSALVVAPALRLPLRAWALFLGLAAAGAAAFAAPGVNPFFALGEYLGRWRWNDSLFALLLAAVGRLAWAKELAAALLAAWVLGVARREQRPELAARSALGALLLMAPTFHPWYALGLLPLVALAPEPGWLWLLAALPLAYGGHPDRLAKGQAELTPALRGLEFGPAFAWWMWAALRRATPKSRSS